MLRLLCLSILLYFWVVFIKNFMQNCQYLEWKDSKEIYEILQKTVSMESVQEAIYCIFPNIQVPVCLEIVFRALLCRIVDPQLKHPSFFTFLSGILYALSFYINYFALRNKFGSSFAGKTIIIQMGYNLVFGLYVSHIFAKSSTLISSLVLQVYGNFMGYPEYF